MKEETKLEKFESYIKHWLFILVKPIYLYSIGIESIEEYSDQMFLESALFFGRNSAKILEDYRDSEAEFYFKENPEQESKINNLIKALKEM